MSALPRIKTGMSVGRLASPSVWITGYLAGAFFFNRSSSALRAFTLALASAGSIRSICLSWFPVTFCFNRAASALRNDVISLSLAWIAAWALSYASTCSLGAAGTSTYSVLAKTPASA